MNINMVSLDTINDTRIKVQISKKLLHILEENRGNIHEIPESLYKSLRNVGLDLPPTIRILKNIENHNTQSLIKIEQLRHMIKENNDNVDDDLKCKDVIPNEDDCLTEIFLYLNELKWLNNFLSELRKHQGLNVYLNDILHECRLQLPQNVSLPRNPILEARCQRLREEQQNREYFKMTKSVNSTVKNHPEDTIAYQMKAINNQIIAVLQFIFSVIAGFVFGFLGLDLIIGNMDFGIRLLLGIMFSLIIALAEIYFLAKKLNEYDTAVDNIKHMGNPHTTPTKSNKLHDD